MTETDRGLHMQLEPGLTIGSYTLLSRLGVGGFAEVWKAREEGELGFKRDVAIKVLKPSHGLEDENFDTLVNEARVGGLLNHPNLVGVHRVGKHDGGWFIVMELVNGVDLDGLHRDLRGRGLLMPRSVVVEVGVAVARALAAAHGATDADDNPLGLVHRDLKPPNILLSRSGSVKVADFGIAKATTNLHTTTSGKMKGTPLYMAPEVWAGTREFTSAIDLFALGAILWELTVGMRLFQGDTTASVVGQALWGDASAEAAKVAERFAPLAPIVEELLQRAPEDRPSDARRIARRIAALRSSVPAPGDLELLLRALELLRQSPAERRDAVAALDLPDTDDPDWARLFGLLRDETVELVTTGQVTFDRPLAASLGKSPSQLTPVPGTVEVTRTGLDDTAALTPEELPSSPASTLAPVSASRHPEPLSPPGPTRAQAAPPPPGRSRALPTFALLAALAGLGWWASTRTAAPPEPEPTPAAVAVATPADATPDATPEATPADPTPEPPTPAPTPAPSAETPTPSRPAATPSPAATPTPRPAPTPAPSPTPSPTPTPEPTPAPTPEPTTSSDACLVLQSSPGGAKVRGDRLPGEQRASSKGKRLVLSPGPISLTMDLSERSLPAVVTLQAGRTATVRCSDFDGKCAITWADGCAK